jgi:hypothetical protein
VAGDGGAAAPAVRLLRRWLRRVLAGYWTDAGYLNWDTGLGFRRWHQAKKLGLAQHALIGIASAPAWDVLFPSWGRRASIVAVRRDGSRVRVTRRRVPLRDVACLRVQSERAGYVVVPLRRAGVVARTIPTAR